MSLKWPLIRWQMRLMQFWNAAIAIVATIYVLTRAKPFTYESPWWFPPLHAAVIAWFLGRTTTPAVGYLHLQGFSRDRLWWHGVVSGYGCALCAWLPAAILILTPLRSLWQDLAQNPYFPYMAPVEHRFVWFSLWLYAVCVPVSLYVAARWGHPAKGNDTGVVLGLLLLGLLLTAVEGARLWVPGSVVLEHWPLFAGGLILAGIALMSGRRLFREVEVQA